MCHETTFYRTKTDSGVNIVQPFLICTAEEETDYYIRAHGHTFHVGRSALLAFSVLLKYYYVFDLEYDTDVLHFYKFMEFIFGFGTSLVASHIEFLSKLHAV